MAASRLSRRRFLLGLAAIGTAFTAGRWPPLLAQAKRRPTSPPAVPPHRVVHAHSDVATAWDYATGWYGDYVNQAVVDTMTDRGMMTLTNTATPTDAWQAVIPNYSTGQKVAIKINLNNAGDADCDDTDQIVDALPQPVNAVIRGLKSIGVAESDIWVYDVTSGWHQGSMPPRLMAKVTALYPGVQFHANAPNCSPALALGYSATENIHFNVPTGKPATSDRPICNALAQARYLINMPIMKKHGMAGVTLSFKNHFGSFEGCDQAHWSVTLSDENYTSSYNAMVDIYNNPHIKDKTVLTIGDGLYGARINNYDEVPSRWPTFGDKSPNSLFFSIDPVAIDCLMYDFLNAEGDVPVPDGSDDYLKLARDAGLGTFEHWDDAHQYHAIDYQRIEVNPLSPRLYLPFLMRNY